MATFNTMQIRQLDALGLRQGKFRQRKKPIAGVVIHTTGYGPWRRWRHSPGRFASPWEAALHIYTEILPYSGHFCVCGETGLVAELVPLDVAAHHVTSAGGYKYRWKNWSRLDKDSEWWRTRWTGLRSPRELMDSRAWSPKPNEVTIGVEVAPPKAGPTYPWSDRTWITLSALCKKLSKLYDIPRDPQHFVGHSDIHPLSRSARNAPWDPGSRQFDPIRDVTRLFQEFAYV